MCIKLLLHLTVLTCFNVLAQSGNYTTLVAPAGQSVPLTVSTGQLAKVVCAYSYGGDEYIDVSVGGSGFTTRHHAEGGTGASINGLTLRLLDDPRVQPGQETDEVGAVGCAPAGAEVVPRHGGKEIGAAGPKIVTTRDVVENEGIGGTLANSVEGRV